MNHYAIRTTALTRDFAAVRAVDSLTLEVPRGVVFGFLGPNGAGKTTTIRLLLGLLEPSSGRAEVLGLDTHTQASSIRQRCGALLEYSGLYERLSAEDNLEFYARIGMRRIGMRSQNGEPVTPSERQARIQELLTHLALWDRRRELVGTWSRGMKQKLAVARALLHRPDLVFLDEPTAGLDPIAAAALREDLARLASQYGTTVFLTTHNLAEAEKLCSLIGVIRQGKLVTQGAPDELRLQAGGAPRLEIKGRNFSPQALAALRSYPEVDHLTQENGSLVVDLKGEVDSAQLVSALVTHGAQIEEVRRSKASLEEVFLTLVQEEEGQS
jgi:ABC-2 type transport system ATP-binding protein